MATKLTINAQTSGKFRTEKIGGRDHIVTSMMPIRGDTSMKGVFYPDTELTDSYLQLNMLQAPESHPVINGEKVSAYHPVAINAHNIGGFVRNPRKKGKRVFVDFCLDLLVANQSKKGKELLRRIRKKKKVGVSTGLIVDRIENASGVDDFGVEYTKVFRGFTFDHVAVLLDDKAAGEHAGTELIVNSLEVSNAVTSSELNEMLNEAIRSPANYMWVREVYPLENIFIYTSEPKGQSGTIWYQQGYLLTDEEEIELVGEPELVKRTVVYKKVRNEMDEEKLVTAIIGNSKTTYTEDNAQELEGKTETQLVRLIVNSVEPKTSQEPEGYAEFVANAELFKAYQAAQATAAKELTTKIVANSEYTEELLNGKPLDELEAIGKLVDNKQATRVTNGTSEPTGTAGTKPKVDYS